MLGAVWRIHTSCSGRAQCNVVKKRCAAPSSSRGMHPAQSMSKASVHARSTAAADSSRMLQSPFTINGHAAPDATKTKVTTQHQKASSTSRPQQSSPGRQPTPISGFPATTLRKRTRAYRVRAQQTGGHNAELPPPLPKQHSTGRHHSPHDIGRLHVQ